MSGIPDKSIGANHSTHVGAWAQGTVFRRSASWIMGVTGHRVGRADGRQCRPPRLHRSDELKVLVR